MHPLHNEHLHAHVGKYEHKAVLQQVEAVQHGAQRKVQGAQPHDGEDIRSEYNERIGGDCENGGDRVYGKYHVGIFDEHEGQKQWRHGFAAIGESCKEIVAIELCRYGIHFANPAHNPAVFWIHFIVALEEHFQSGKYEECAKYIESPVKGAHKSSASKNHERTHDNGAQNTPEEHAMLVFSGNLEKPENHSHHEDIVERKGILDDITGEIINGGGFAIHESHACAIEPNAEPVVTIGAVDKGAEGEADHHPDHRPAKCVFGGWLGIFFMEDSKVESEQGADEG